MPINMMDKQNVIYAYSRIIFSLKKEWDLDTCDKDEPLKH